MIPYLDWLNNNGAKKQVIAIVKNLLKEVGNNQILQNYLLFLQNLKLPRHR